MTQHELESFIKTHTEDEIDAEVSKIRCTMCGKPFTRIDLSLGDNRYDILVNYPSKYDLKRLQFNFCIDCFDKVLDTVIPMCKIDSVVDDDWMEHCLTEDNKINMHKGPGGPTSLY